MANPHIRFSILICTNDRDHFLLDLLSSLRIQDYPRDAIEVIVINNASTNRAKAIVTQFQDSEKLPLTYTELSTPGLSRARNYGAQMASGDVILYLDDDVIASQNLLSSFEKAFWQCKESTVCIGGGITPKWQNDELPSWLPDEFLSYFGSTNDLGNQAHYLTDFEYPLGGNLAIRRQIVLDIGGFSESLGKKGNVLLSNEETDFCRRIRTAGYAIFFEPAASVRHRVSIEKASKIWLLKRLYWQGISDSIMIWQSERPNKYDLLSRVLVNTKNGTQKIALGLILNLSCQKKNAISHFASGVAYFGRVHQDIRLLLGAI